MHKRARNVLGLVFLTVFLDMVGFSVLFPLFPRMLEHYLALEGEASAIGRLAALLARVAGEGHGASFAVTTLFGGVLGSLYSLLQFLAAPFWGALSDRIGRRPTLLVTLAGTALSYVLWLVAGTFVLLVVARILGGIMAGNISTASAAIADTFDERERVRGMGVLGAGIGLGFVVGPVIGGVASGWSLGDGAPGFAGFGLHPFSGVALIAFALALVNLAWVAARFPETLVRTARAEHETERTLHPFRALRRIDLPGVRRTVIVNFVFVVAFSAMEFTLTFLTHERLEFDIAQQTRMFVFIGLTIALVQGGLVRRVTPRLGERVVAVAGIALTLPGFLLVGTTRGIGQLYAGLALLAVGSACIMPCLSALVSRYSPRDRQGLAMGVFRSAGALARAIGPLSGGIAFWLLGSHAPYVAGAAVLVLPLALALRLPAPATASEKDSSPLQEAPPPAR